ncbi:MAG: tetratricopeptide repeat protein [Desulfobacteraceae bacterium]|jgi:tetratricopeptide (TPR) repeat protein|nr:tetratricopeptide repeat protein [Desulfobacteraceae bacterium]
MTTDKNTLLHSHESTRHFLFSKTETGRLQDVKSQEIIDADEAVRSSFPDMLSGSDFIDRANRQLEAAAQFSAMVIRLDQVKQNSDPAELTGGNEGFVETAGILDGLCCRENGLWGTLDAGLFGSFFPEKNGSDSLELARGFQKHLKEKTGKSVTIGIAAFPTLAYKKPEIIKNAGKALDHASFFGANSLVAFDDVSLNISGDKLFEEGNIIEAITEFKLALELDPNNVNVHNSLGVCYGLQGQYDSAIAEFKKAIALAPREYMALYNLGLVHLLMKQPDRALEYFLGADKINGNNYEVTFQTGKLYLETGNFEKSRFYLERAAQLEPESGQAHRYLGDSYSAGNRPEAAISAYKKAIKCNPDNAAALSALGSIFDDRGENPEITLMFLRESIALSPENGLFHHRLGRHFSHQDRLNDALKEFVRAKSLGYDATEDIKAIKDRQKVEK